jgi:hypothetical protein
VAIPDSSIDSRALAAATITLVTELISGLREAGVLTTAQAENIIRSAAANQDDRGRAVLKALYPHLVA